MNIPLAVRDDYINLPENKKDIRKRNIYVGTHENYVFAK